MFAELSGALLSALLARNARFAGRADFLYLAPGVSYALRPRGGGALPTNGFEKEELDEGALEAVPSSISVWGAPLDTCSTPPSGRALPRCCRTISAPVTTL